MEFVAKKYGGNQFFSHQLWGLSYRLHYAQTEAAVHTSSVVSTVSPSYDPTGWQTVLRLHLTVSKASHIWQSTYLLTTLHLGTNEAMA